MSRFTEALVVSPLADGRTWVILTIPRPFWVILPKWGRYGNASVIHDWLYWMQTRPRREADAIFLEARGVLGVTPLVKHAMYWAVHLFGGLAWYRNRAERAGGFDRVFRDLHLKSVVRSQRRGVLRQLASHALHRLRQGPGSLVF